MDGLGFRWVMECLKRPIHALLTSAFLVLSVLMADVCEAEAGKECGHPPWQLSSNSGLSLCPNVTREGDPDFVVIHRPALPLLDYGSLWI